MTRIYKTTALDMNLALRSNFSNDGAYRTLSSMHPTELLQTMCDPVHSVCAYTSGKPQYVFRVWSLPYTVNGVPMNGLAWCVYIGIIDENGVEDVFADTVYYSLREALNHLIDYTDESVVWVDDQNKEVSMEYLLTIVE